jgi:hypothetical protein
VNCLLAILQADVLHYASKIIELLQQTSSAAPYDCAHAQATAAALVHEHKAQQLLAELQATNISCASGDNSGNGAAMPATFGSGTGSDDADVVIDAPPPPAPAAAPAAAAAGGSSATCSSEQPYTTQLLREVFAPDRVLEQQAMGLQELVSQFRKLTFRMAFQLNAPANRAALLSSSLEVTLHEYA